jgi:hypothetical protein
MNEEAEKKLKELLQKGVPALNQEEIDFIRARRSYLTASEEEKYKEILEDKPPVVPEPTRSELNEQAKELGIEEPEKMKSKAEVLKAIEEAKK